jgi:hypothetical protein
MKPPAEFKVMRVRECLAPADLVDTPERAYQYWRANIPKADWYDPAKEAFVVFILNARRRIIGHNLVALGSLDSVFVNHGRCSARRLSPPAAPLRSPTTIPRAIQHRPKLTSG